MISDANKGITGISYNHFNVPTKVTVSGSNNGTIDFVYDADGIKLQKIKTENGTTTTTDYVGNYIYEKPPGGSAKLQFFNTPEGYVTPKDVNDYSAGFDYVYNYVDHLGNIRLSYTDADGDGSIDPANEIVKESNYYPFGLAHKGYNNNVSSLGNSAAKKYMFGGKESQDEFGLGWYDVTARNYDPALGRWMNLDPLAEQMRRHSPYNFGFDNPIYFQDYDGMMPTGPGDPPKKKIQDAMISFGETVMDGLKAISDGLSAAGESISDFADKISGGEGSGGYDFTSKNGGGDQDRQGGRDVQQVDGDVILAAGTIAGTSAAPASASL